MGKRKILNLEIHDDIPQEFCKYDTGNSNRAHCRKLLAGVFYGRALVNCHILVTSTTYSYSYCNFKEEKRGGNTGTQFLAVL
jgi:hypothetical protein